MSPDPMDQMPGLSTLEGPRTIADAVIPDEPTPLDTSALVKAPPTPRAYSPTEWAERKRRRRLQNASKKRNRRKK